MNTKLLIKICGVTCPEDAYFASSSGADFIGMILWKGSKRYVDMTQAKEIIDAARRGGAVPVGIFVSGTAKEIAKIVRELELQTIQLHGFELKGYLEELSKKFQCFYAASISHEGQMNESDKHRIEILYHKISYLVCDHAMGGTGVAFDWKNFDPPKLPWILAGGINVDNVTKAMHLPKLIGFDICSGVEVKGTIKKDRDLVLRLIEKIRKEGE